MILDTHIWIWWVTEDNRLSKSKLKDIKKATGKGGIKISIISCWELCKLVEKGKIGFSIPLKEWMHSAIRYPGLELLEITPNICLESCNLPGDFHGDPADQIIVATSRLLNLPLVTEDKKIINYPHIQIAI